MITEFPRFVVTCRPGADSECQQPSGADSTISVTAIVAVSGTTSVAALALARLRW